MFEGRRTKKKNMFERRALTSIQRANRETLLGKHCSGNIARLKAKHEKGHLLSYAIVHDPNVSKNRAVTARSYHTRKMWLHRLEIAARAIGSILAAR
jgi:hypothetical protein